MKFSENHRLHFIIILILVLGLASGIFVEQGRIDTETRNTNRLASVRLIANALEIYKKSYNKYPEKLDELHDFLQPIPTDIGTGKSFEYHLKDKQYLITIPQEGKKDLQILGGK